MPEIKDYISENDEKEIVNAIKIAEKQTSGEIRLHLELLCHLDDTYQRALQIFDKLEMHNTKHSNGILIYVAFEEHKIVIYGDKGIHDKVGIDYWQSTIKLITTSFSKDKYKEGLINGVSEIGHKLKTHFPYLIKDHNELTDDISKG